MQYFDLRNELSDDRWWSMPAGGGTVWFWRHGRCFDVLYADSDGFSEGLFASVLTRFSTYGEGRIDVDDLYRTHKTMTYGNRHIGTLLVNAMLTAYKREHSASTRVIGLVVPHLADQGEVDQVRRLRFWSHFGLVADAKRSRFNAALADVRPNHRGELPDLDRVSGCARPRTLCSL